MTDDNADPIAKEVTLGPRPVPRDQRAASLSPNGSALPEPEVQPQAAPQPQAQHSPPARSRPEAEPAAAAVPNGTTRPEPPARPQSSPQPQAQPLRQSRPQPQPSAPPQQTPQAASQPQQPAQPPRVKFDTTGLKSTYCNVCNGSSTREEVVLNFGINTTWDRATGEDRLDVALHHRIIMSPHAAKRIRDMMARLIEEHEVRYGKLDG